MKINIDVGNRLEGWHNVDIFCHTPLGAADGKVESWWPPLDKKAEEIKVYRTFERLKDKLHRFLIDVRKALADDGILTIYAIKHDEFIDFQTGINGYEICYGPNWTMADRWVQHYNNANIIDILTAYGFKHIGTAPDKANYPSTALQFKKSYLQVPTQYLSKYLPTDTNLNTVDIGPGNHPWALAKNYIEHPSRLTDERYKPENMPKVNVFFGNLEEGIPEIKDKQFDFAWASHIFEHLKDPVAGAKELSRIAKRGVVVVPSSYKDSQTYWEEWEHRWDIFPPRVGSLKPRFVLRNDDWLKSLKDQEMQAIFGRLYRYQNYETREERYVKQFFMDNESSYDVVIEWNDTFEIETI
jgi:SAM-dependent methyltransferase